MDFEFTEEQHLLRKTIRSYIKKECPPDKEREREAREELPDDRYRKMGAMGPTLAPFRTRAGAEAFVAEYGGAIRRLDGIDAALLADLRRQGMSHLDQD